MTTLVDPSPSLPLPDELPSHAEKSYGNTLLIASTTIIFIYDLDLVLLQIECSLPCFCYKILSVGIRVACWEGSRTTLFTEPVIGLAIQDYTMSSYRSAGMPDLTMCLRFGCDGMHYGALLTTIAYFQSNGDGMGHEGSPSIEPHSNRL